MTVGCHHAAVRWTVVLFAASLLLGGCATSAEVSPSLGAAAQAAADAEFTIVTASQRTAFPAWRGRDLDGYDWNTTNLGPQRTVVNFWASWCQPCVQEWADLQESAATYDRVVFVGVNSKDSRTEARRFLKEYPSEYRHLDDPDAALLQALTGIPHSTLPTTVILDAQHQIAAWKVGPTTSGQIKRALEQLYRSA